MPYRDDGEGNAIYNIAECVAWCRERGLDFFDKDKKEPSLLQQQKLRQETHKANELQFKEQLRNNEYCLVTEATSAIEETAQALMQATVEIVEAIKVEAGLSGSAAERIDAELAARLNAIATRGVGE